MENFRVQLTKSGHEVFVFAPNYRRRQALAAADEKKVFRFPSVGLGKDASNYALALPFTPAIDAVVKNSNFDLIHSQHPYWIGQTAMWYARRLKIPLVFTYHTLYEEYSHYVPVVPQTLLKWYLKKSSLEYALKSDVIIAPSQSVKTMLEERVAEYLSSMHIVSVLKKEKQNIHIRVVPSGIDVEKFKNADGASIREKYNFKKGDKILLCVCRLAAEKNLDFLVKSLAPLLKKDDHIYLMLVGHGPYKENLIALARELSLTDKIKFIGLVPNDKIASYYKAADIFVYASITETQGLIVAEALSAGLPVVAVDASGSRDILVNNKNGFLTAAHQGEFREKVESVIENPNLYQRLRQEALVTAEDYSRENCTKKLIAAYEEAASFARERKTQLL